MLRNMQNLMLDPVAALIRLLCVLVALSFHEFAHAWAAHRMGDDTARAMGRMTLDPLRHIDVFGLISMFIFGFGWAKPVPINPNQFRNLRSGSLLVSLAGVAMNLLLAIVSVFACYTLAALVGVDVVQNRTGNLHYLSDFWQMLAFLNIGLMVFNLLPIPPLDGYQAAKSLVLGHVNLNWLWRYEKYGGLVLIALCLLGLLSKIIQPPILTVFVAIWSSAAKLFGFFLNLT